MKKNSRVKIIMDTEFFNQIKKQAFEKGISISEFCRQKLRTPSDMEKIEFLLGEIYKKLGMTSFKNSVAVKNNRS